MAAPLVVVFDGWEFVLTGASAFRILCEHDPGRDRCDHETLLKLHVTHRKFADREPFPMSNQKNRTEVLDDGPAKHYSFLRR